ERLHETGGETYGEAVLVPHLLASAGGEADAIGFRQSLAVEVFPQDAFGLGFFHEAAGIDVAVARAMLQRNAPLRAGRASRRARIGREWFGSLARDGERAIAR